MRELTLAQIDELEHGEIVPSFRAKIIKVWEQKTGEGQYGTWFLQNLVATDGWQESTITWTGPDAFDDGAKGDTFLFECAETKKGLKGITRDIREFNDKVYQGVKVTEAAKISISTLDEGDVPASPARKSPVASGERKTARLPGREASEAAKPFASRRHDPPAADDRSNRIERQHSQEMALRAIAITKQVVSTQSLREWTDYFQRDIGRPPSSNEPQPESQDAITGREDEE